MTNREKGLTGEALAKKYLISVGCHILATNYKTNLGEIDIIMTDNDTLVFVEVKLRTSVKFGTPAEAVNIFKQRKISHVAAQYIKRHFMQGVKVRFDIVEVSPLGINHIKSAFDSFLRY